MNEQWLNMLAQLRPQIDELTQAPSQPQQQERLLPPNVAASVTVPLSTGELFARGMYAPQEQKPLQSWGFGYRMRF